MTAKVAGVPAGHDVLPWLVYPPTAKESNNLIFSLSHTGIPEAFFLCFLCFYVVQINCNAAPFFHPVNSPLIYP